MTTTQSIETLFAERQYNECLKLISKVTQDQQNQDILRIKGFCLQRTEQQELAMEVWNVLIAHDPKCAEYFAERGVCKFHLKFKSALSDFNTSVELDPSNAYRYACRAFVRDKLGDTEGAIEDYRTSVELDPDNEVTLNNLGLLEEKLGYQSHAQTRFKQADELLGQHEGAALNWENQAQPEEVELPKTKWSEIKKMLSSWTEFKKFLKEVFERKV